jgi:hypothetical protein
MRQKRHISVNIEGLLRNYKRKKITFLEDDNGKRLSDSEARMEIAKLQALGHKLIGCGDDCEGFDPFGGGCPGHNIPDDEII